MSLLPDQYDKYLRFFQFMIKYWNSDVFSIPEEQVSGSDNDNKPDEFGDSPEELAEDLKAMGPTYVKLGQLLSTRPDLLPPHFMKALATLQDDVEVVDYQVIEQIFREEIGVRISKAFASFEKEPLASASIGQVHKAVMHSGKVVAVKIQRPGIRKRFIEDLDALMALSEKAEKFSETARNYAVHDVIEELRYILLKELDYTLEAQNLSTLKSNLQDFPNIFIPAPINDYCSSRVLTMEFVEGGKITKISPLKRLEVNLEPLVDDLVKAYLSQIIVDGFAHADPHPGNVYLTPDTKIALMDLGMVAKFSDELQETILKLMIGLSNYDSARVTNILLSISTYNENDVDLDLFRKMIARKVQESENQKAKDLQTGRTIIEINQIAAKEGIHIPVELNILGKILLNMDQIVAHLSPEYDMHNTVKEYVHLLMQKRMKDNLKPANLMELFLEMKELTENLPFRLNKFTENLAENKIRVKVDAIDEHRFTEAFQKVANRITAGLIIAALIVGAAMLVRVPSSWTIGGYPAFAFFLFIIAAIIGLYLLYQILIKDEMKRKK
ncbi:ABC1 kinase family protein [Aequorivita viscosa]|uniref:Predicted unusual protein kinase regulating ubiquinone biosynthesis, AarF/ABC1/UbiB family n=1 Tax=Aequorivita viscosa TaxID=797419 RepID=A0A1M6F2D8_9FLAO|nr:AarF/UbiB family protein [Aequorivita viscosa]SDW64210.1 Predicted unusual protein kinase regulating ubiquinone biosynthesis, AarF/ABC1/UbiB family [Aequorivita viscosa]SHI91852.1 Predicted unusual protein kinase regulating ubiquinone biosynthesis, AarF/ABC1/UbiB family [Aequorivita viscosa]